MSQPKWISLSFGADFASTMSCSQQKKRPTTKNPPSKRVKLDKSPDLIDLTNSIDTHKNVTTSCNEDYVPWSERYKPNSEQELAVNKKKVEEIRNWLLNCLSREQPSKILLLDGPSGSGKTACLLVIAAELGVEIKEWINPLTEDFQESQPQQRWLSLNSSVHNKFRDFLLRANRYGSLALTKDTLPCQGQSIVVVEDMPNVYYYDKNKLHDTLKQFHSIARWPVVFIMSDTQDDRTSTHTLFPKGLQSELSITNISLNAATTTSLVKNAHRIQCALEAQGMGDIMFPDKRTLDLIIADSAGDIRNCVNSLEFACTRAIAPQKSKIPKGLKPPKRKADKSTKRSKSDKEQSVSSSGRDASLFFFHALGKVLYCKRDPDASDQKLLPRHLQSHQRQHLTSIPEKIYEATHISADMFNLYLHQNYIEFFTSIESLSLACENFSDADLMIGNWSNRDTMNDYSASTVTRGLMFSLGSEENKNASKSRGWKPLVKPVWYETRKNMTDHQRDIIHHYQSHACSSNALFTEIVPFESKIKQTGRSFNRPLSKGSLNLPRIGESNSTVSNKELTAYEGSDADDIDDFDSD